MEDLKYCIVSDSDCDLPTSLCEELGIEVVPFYVSFDDENYLKENIDIEVRDFYQQMVDKKGVYPKSSMPSVQDYYDVFEAKVKSGLAVICICITEKFSGSYQSAFNARRMIREDYPDAEITVIDSTLDTVCQGIYVLEAVSMLKKGVSYMHCVEQLMAIRDTGRIFFTVGDMEYLQHGGRIGKLTGIAASVLGIKPLITLKEGEIFPSGITRSRAKSLKKVIDLLLEYIKNDCESRIDEYSFCIGYGYDREEAENFKKQALEELSSQGYDLADIPLYQIGATIGVHTGPYPLGFGVVKHHKYY